MDTTRVVVLMIGEAVVIGATILVVYWFFFRRSGSRRERTVTRHEAVPSDAPDAQQEWPSLAQKIASAWLVVVEGGDKGAHHAVGQGTTLIGRGSLCDIILEDPTVSRRHARIIRQGDQFFIYDADSMTGTLVDGKKVILLEGTPLRDGSVISIGQMRFVFKER